MKKLVWILLALLVIGSVGVYMFSKDKVGGINIVSNKGIKATVFINNNYQKGSVDYDFAKHILYVNTEHFTHHFSFETEKLKDIMGTGMGVVKDECGDVYMMGFQISSTDSFERAAKGEEVKPYIKLVFKLDINVPSVEFKIEGEDAVEFIRQGIVDDIFVKPNETATNPPVSPPSNINIPEVISDHSSTRDVNPRALFPGRETTQKSNISKYDAFFERLNKLKKKAGHPTWGDESLDSEDIDWLMTLTDQEILDMILEDKSKLGVAIAEDSKIANMQSSASTNTGYGLANRSIVGNLPRPDYSVNESGVVVVEIEVDKDGYVTKASYREQGSTTDNTELIKSAINAAKRARFTSGDEEQVGTITYNFRLH